MYVVIYIHTCMTEGYGTAVSIWTKNESVSGLTGCFQTLWTFRFMKTEHPDLWFFPPNFWTWLSSLCSGRHVPPCEWGHSCSPPVQRAGTEGLLLGNSSNSDKRGFEKRRTHFLYSWLIITAKQFISDVILIDGWVPGYFQRMTEKGVLAQDGGPGVAAVCRPWDWRGWSEDVLDFCVLWA